MKLYIAVSGSIRSEIMQLHYIQKLINMDKATIQYHGVPAEGISGFNGRYVEQVIKDCCLGYPLAPIGVNQEVDGKLIFHLNSKYWIIMNFLENNIKYEGLTLSEFEDAGYFESLSVMTYVFSPSSELNAFYFL